MLAIVNCLCSNTLMQGQESPDLPEKLAQFWKAYRVPIILGLVSIFFIIASLTILIKSVQTSTPITFSSDEASVAGAMRGSEVVVDVAGAVVRPGVYNLPVGSRVEDAIAAAGGLSAEVDDDRLAKVVNRAAKLSDGAKIYIPKVGDTMTGFHPASLTGWNPVSVNAASQSELEALSGIGPATAKKIIAGRPYTSLEELVAKKAIGQALFDKLKGQLTL